MCWLQNFRFYFGIQRWKNYHWTSSNSLFYWLTDWLSDWLSAQEISEVNPYRTQMHTHIEKYTQSVMHIERRGQNETKRSAHIEYDLLVMPM